MRRDTLDDQRRQRGGKCAGTFSAKRGHGSFRKAALAPVRTVAPVRDEACGSLYGRGHTAGGSIASIPKYQALAGDESISALGLSNCYKNCFCSIKKERRWQAFETDPHASAALLPLPSINRDKFDSESLDMIDRLSPASLAVLLLHYQQNLSIEETAAILAIPVGTAKSRLAHGVAKLREFIKEKEPK